MSVKIDRRKLKTKKRIIATEINERTSQLSVEFGADIDSTDVIESVVHVIDVLAERMGITPKEIWTTLFTIYRGGLGGMTDEI